MPRKRKPDPLPYLTLLMYSYGKILFSVNAPRDGAPGINDRRFGATMKVAVGTDRLACAVTMVEVARDLLKSDTELHKALDHTAAFLIAQHALDAGRFIQELPDGLPF
jgi:hypothetical protein